MLLLQKQHSANGIAVLLLEKQNNNNNNNSAASGEAGQQESHAIPEKAYSGGQ
jgi:hypothetical protein